MPQQETIANRKLLPLILMVATILVIAIFQLYWLRNNYREEMRLFNGKTRMLLKETILRVQATKLNLGANVDVHVEAREGLVAMAQVLRETISPSDTNGKGKATFFIRVERDKHGPPAGPDTQVALRDRKGPVGDLMLKMDSIQGAITTTQISEAYQKALKDQKMDLAFTLSLVDSLRRPGTFVEDQPNQVTIGYGRPKTYQLDFISASWYILRRIWPSILLSVLLVGITIASLVVLYNNWLKQQRLIQLKNDFIGNITHELKTPIATVSVAIEALRNFNAMHDEARTKEYLDISGQEIKRLGLLVDNVLRISSYEAKGVALQIEDIDLRSLVGEVVASMKIQFDKVSATVRTEYSGNNFLMQGDRLHMASVIYNLLDNALKYSPNNPAIDVSVVDKGNELELTVTDKGIGIPAEYQHRVFEQFFRVPEGNRHTVKGYGLGLSYVSHIVKEHNGNIQVKSIPGDGTSFSIIFPRRG